MKKRKIIGFIIILVGILTISYPITLRIESNIEQKSLKEEFLQKKKDSKVLLNETSNEKEITSYDAWPETLMTMPTIKVEAMVVEMESSDIDVFAQDVKLYWSHSKSSR